MRLAIALSLLAQSLPVASKIEDVSPVLSIENDESQKDVRMRLLPNDEETSRVRTFGQRVMMMDRKQDRTKNNEFVNRRGSLRNLMTVKKECDPTTNDEADVGVLTCGVGKYCMASDASGLGGYCVSDTMKLDRQLWNTDDGTEDGTGDDTTLGYYYDGCAAAVSYSSSNGTQFIAYCFNATSYDKSFCIGSDLDIAIGSTCVLFVDDVQCTSCYLATDYATDPSITKCSGPIADAIGFYDHVVFDCENAGAGSGEYSCVDDIPGSDEIAIACNTTLALLATPS